MKTFNLLGLEYEEKKLILDQCQNLEYIIEEIQQWSILCCLFSFFSFSYYQTFQFLQNRIANKLGFFLFLKTIDFRKFDVNTNLNFPLVDWLRHWKEKFRMFGNSMISNSMSIPELWFSGRIRKIKHREIHHRSH